MDHDSSQPLNLAAAAAAAAADMSSFMDPLTTSSDFFPHTHSEHLDVDVGGVGVGAPSQDVIDAVIKASLDHAQAQAQAEAEAAAAAAAAVAQAQAQASTTSADASAAPSTEPGTSASKGKSKTPKEPKAKKPKPRDLGAVPGTEFNPITNPIIHLAPFSKPERTDESPHPEHYEFENRQQFEVWLTGETSWCHYVQRRSTTPDKRSAERLQARIRAHERSLDQMTPEERLQAQPLKTRKRNRVSPVLEKVTFTCHHSGSYTSKHSDVLPKEKLRLNTKKSVKCACASRIVLNENQGGDCRVVYHWKHEGHDPYSEGDAESGRLPKVIDTWLTGQIEAGKTLDDIRRALAMSEEQKTEYLAKIQANPSLLDPFLPPPLALTSKIKYPDIYNRYRKLKGPVKENKPPKSSSSNGAGSKRTASGTMKKGSGSGSGAGTGTGTNGTATPVREVDGQAKEEEKERNAHEHEHIDPSLQLHDSTSTPTNAPTLALAQHLQPPQLTHTHTQNGTQGPTDPSVAPMAPETALTTHDGLAQALLALPSGGLRDEDGLEISLEEAMSRMADSVGVGAVV